MQKLLIGLLLLLAVGCSSTEEEAQALPPTLDETDLGTESFGVEYYFSDSARVTAQMLAAHVIEKEEGIAGAESPEENEKKETIHYLDGGVELYFLNFSGRSHSTIKAEKARFQRERGIAKLTGNVIMTNYKGETMNTEELYWDQEKDSVFTDKFVRIETPDKVIIGRNGLRANSDFTAYTIYGIQGELETDDP